MNTPPRGREPDSSSVWRMVGEYTGLALTVPAAGLIGFVAGAALDTHFHTGRLWTVILGLCGAGAGLGEILRVASRR